MTERVDCRGMRCPWPALRASRALRSAVGVLVIADDPIAPSELAAMAAERGWTFAEAADPDGPAFLIRK